MADQAPKLRLLRSDSTDPFANLALEEAAAAALADDEWLLFLWQNERTVVVGRNQNAWKECAVEALEADGGRVARRRSGGGAVYHDVGNLNFTFAAPREGYSFARNLDVICQAVRSFGLDARVSGRNDVTVGGAKFSGNAFFRTGGVQVHHGTLMVAVDTAEMARYLRPDARKLKAKGVASVRSRVVNLSELSPSLSVVSLAGALEAAFARVGGGAAEPFDRERIDAGALARSRERYASWEWRLGASRPFEHTVDERFDWGLIEFAVNVKEGMVDEVAVRSDAMDADFVEAIEQACAGVRYRADDVAGALEALSCDTPEQERMRRDCAALLRAALS